MRVGVSQTSRLARLMSVWVRPVYGWPKNTSRTKVLARTRSGWYRPVDLQDQCLSELNQYIYPTKVGWVKPVDLLDHELDQLTGQTLVRLIYTSRLARPRQVWTGSIKSQLVQNYVVTRPVIFGWVDIQYLIKFGLSLTRRLVRPELVWNWWT